MARPPPSRQAASSVSRVDVDGSQVGVDADAFAVTLVVLEEPPQRGGWRRKMAGAFSSSSCTSARSADGSTRRSGSNPGLPTGGGRRQARSIAPQLRSGAEYTSGGSSKAPQSAPPRHHTTTPSRHPPHHRDRPHVHYPAHHPGLGAPGRVIDLKWAPCCAGVAARAASRRRGRRSPRRVPAYCDCTHPNRWRCTERRRRGPRRLPASPEPPQQEEPVVASCKRHRGTPAEGGRARSPQSARASPRPTTARQQSAAPPGRATPCSWSDEMGPHPA